MFRISSFTHSILHRITVLSSEVLLAMTHLREESVSHSVVSGIQHGRSLDRAATGMQHDRPQHRQFGLSTF